jgi:hypothetical protein
MASDNQSKRAPRDLPVPETMKIAALLAELMPPGSNAPPVPLAPKSEEALDEAAAGPFSAPVLQIEDLDDLEGEIPSPASVPLASSLSQSDLTSVPPLLTQVPAPTIGTTETVASDLPSSASTLSPPEPESATTLPSDANQPEAATERTAASTAPAPVTDDAIPAEAGAVAIGEFLTKLNWTNSSQKSEVPPDATSPAGEALEMTTRQLESARPSRASTPAHDQDLVPLGHLTFSGFLALVNWTNDPQRVKQPRRVDYGLDEPTLQQARKNPFYLVGQPRRPERDSVAEVMAEISWE